MATLVKPGITTASLDHAAEQFMQKQGGKAAFKGYHGFPGTLCTSVNDECVHGIPGERTLAEGDIVSLDGGVIVDGLYTDACITVPVGTISKEAQHLLHVTKNALDAALAVLKEGVHVGDISATIQEIVETGGCHCIPALTGHGLGTTLHQFPDVPNVGKKRTGPVLPANTIIAIEPITSLGSSDITQDDDGWTLRTKDHSLSAHFEHTVLITLGGYEILA